MTIINNTNRNILQLKIEHRIYQQSTKNIAIINNLKKGKQISCLWTFNVTAPSIAKGVIVSLFTFGIGNAGNDWGKDYWLITADF